MQAIHVFWTAPYRARGIDIGVNLVMPPLECLVLAASALVWRAHSGGMKLFTDTPGRACVERWGIADLWSKIDCAVLDAAPDDVDPAVFWDFGKTLALAACETPVAMLDLDLVVWRALEVQAAVQFLHWEEIEEPWYPPLGVLPVPPGYDFPEVELSVRPGNTALVYIGDPRFRDRFVAESLAYAQRNAPNGDQKLAAFLFSGQRLFTIIGALGPWDMRPFIPYIHRAHGAGEWVGKPPTSRNPLDPLAFLDGWPYMHLWSFKHLLRKDRETADQFAAKLIDHARTVAPHAADRLHAIWQYLCVSVADLSQERSYS
jgi:hypothetical protein